MTYEKLVPVFAKDRWLVVVHCGSTSYQASLYYTARLERNKINPAFPLHIIYSVKWTRFKTRHNRRNRLASISWRLSSLTPLGQSPIMAQIKVQIFTKCSLKSGRDRTWWSELKQNGTPQTHPRSRGISWPFAVVPLTDGVNFLIEWKAQEQGTRCA